MHCRLSRTGKIHVLYRLAGVDFVVAREAIEKVSLDELSFIPVSLNPSVFHDEF
jgi:hypothetical protein